MTDVKSSLTFSPLRGRSDMRRNSRLAPKAEFYQNGFLLGKVSSPRNTGKQASKQTKLQPPWTHFLHSHRSSCLSTAVLTAPGQATATPSRPPGNAAGGNLCKGDKDLEMAVICTLQR